MNEINKKRVFIIGAGASSEYGIPLGESYLEKCLSYAKEDIDYKEKVKEITDYLNNLIPIGEKEWIYKPFEVILSLIEKDRIIRNQIAGVSSEPYMGDALIACLCKYLWHKSNHPKINEIEYRYETEDDIKKMPEGEYPYKKFIEKLDNINDTIITTNYDALLDRAVFVRWKNIRYSAYNSLLLKGHENPSILLLKPLGSITWIPEIKYYREFIIDSFKNGVYQLSDNPIIWAYRVFPEYFDIAPEISTVEYPVIIPPTIGADIPHYWGNFFIDLYKQLLNKLSIADEIYIIGYSFPEYYELFRILMQKALQFNNNKVELSIINYKCYPKPEEYTKNNKLPVHEIIQRYITKKELKYYNDGFKEWLQKWVKGNDKVDYITINSDGFL